jgi:hypothetical protein
MIAEANADCMRVDVRSEYIHKNIEQAPTINDPNANIILDINPPLLSGGFTAKKDGAESRLHDKKPLSLHG